MDVGRLAPQRPCLIFVHAGVATVRRGVFLFGTLGDAFCSDWTACASMVCHFASSRPCAAAMAGQAVSTARDPYLYLREWRWRLMRLLRDYQCTILCWCWCWWRSPRCALAGCLVFWLVAARSSCLSAGLAVAFSVAERVLRSWRRSLEAIGGFGHRLWSTAAMRGPTLLGVAVSA